MAYGDRHPQNPDTQVVAHEIHLNDDDLIFQ